MYQEAVSWVRTAAILLADTLVLAAQANATRMAIARALEQFDPDLRFALKSAGFLSRDPRMVERKKPGKAKARKSFTWHKR